MSSDVAVVIALMAAATLVVSVPIAIRVVRRSVQEATDPPDQAWLTESLSSRTSRFHAAGVAARDALVKEPERRPLVRSGLQPTPGESIAGILVIEAQSSGFDADVAMEIAEFALSVRSLGTVVDRWRALAAGVRL